ncbi:MAG: DUF922 domain-containing protein [bacterium]|nr:DUF922 domain-containing protein [bacterium]
MNRTSTSFPALLLGLFFFCYSISGFYYIAVFSKPVRPFPDESIVIEKKEKEIAVPKTVADIVTPEREVQTYIPPAPSASPPSLSQVAYPKPSPEPAPTPLPTEISVSANVTYSTSTIYYDIYGLTENELRAEMSAKGPSYSDGKRYDGFTSRYYTWKYFPAWDGKNCYPNEVYVTVGIKMTLPQWMWYINGGESLKTKWTNYMNVLIYHESGHVDINIRGADDLYQRLINAGPYPNCGQLDTALHQIANTFYNDIGIQNEAYDAITNHGETQGAVFP